MKALVTGANGMLADALCPILKERSYTIYPTDLIRAKDILKLDVRNLGEVTAHIGNIRPDVVFHLAAETDVDKCELEKEHAYAINANGTENIALACKKFDCVLVYISTAAVFDGKKEGGYNEQDAANPISVYGRSKLEGEKIVKSLLTRCYIVRAGWMIGGYGKDKKFVWKIIQLLKTKNEISAVIDKIGSPTFTKDFSKGLLDIMGTNRYGIYHCVNNGICTRYDIAKKIVEYLGRLDVVIKPVTSEVFPLPAPRGKSEALVNDRLSRLNINNMRPWEDALKEYIDQMSP